MNKFLDTHNQPRHSQEFKNLNTTIMSNETEILFEVSHLKKKKKPRRTNSNSSSTSPKIYMEETLPICFYEDSIILMTKPDKVTTKRATKYP
jgi:hypothetical protein